MNTWAHLSQVPEGIRTTMIAAFAPWDRQDLGIDGMVDAMLQCPAVTQATGRALRSSANAVRVPALVRIVAGAHPELSKRDAFQAVALFCGLYTRHVQRLYYTAGRTHVSSSR
jgi:hypothetical protein